MAPASLASQSDGVGDPAHWVSAPHSGQAAASVLVLPAVARIAYHVTLPDQARIIARCDVSVELPEQNAVDVEFTILASVEGRQAECSCLVASGDSGQLLCLTLERGGPATIVLATRVVAGTSLPGVRARWRNPRVEWRRPSRDVIAALGNLVRRRTLTALGHANTAVRDERLYRLWVRENEPSRRTLRAQREWAAPGSRPLTLITLLPEDDWLSDSRTLDSLLGQSVPHWEWLVLTTVTDRQLLARAERDPRVRIMVVDTGMTAAASLNQALTSARGEFAALVDNLDVLAPAALFEMAQAASASGGADVLYSDEDRMSDTGARFEPAFKPDWSPDLLLSCNYIGRLAMIRVATAVAAGGFRDGFGGAAEWELLLRLSRAGARFKRVAACLYHRHETARSIEPADRDAVLVDHGGNLGLRLEVTGSPDASRLRWKLAETPLVSVVIPNRNAFAVLKTCVDGLLEGTSYPNRELIIVDNGSTDRDVLDLYARLERERRGRIVAFDRPFNFSAACNAGAAAASGDLLLFLNNDIEVVEPDWMEELVRWAQRPGVGVVGAQLLYPDRMVQHAGVVFGLGLVGHIFSRAAEHTRGVFGSSDWYRNYLAVTGACQMVPRAVFGQLGGYDERFRLSFSDVMLCMDAWKAGYRVVYTPHARLIHHESYTRQKEDSAEDMELFARYLRREQFVEDPYLHPHLDSRSLIPAVRPPFEPAPRQVIAQYIERVLASAYSQPL